MIGFKNLCSRHVRAYLKYLYVRHESIKAQNIRRIERQFTEIDVNHFADIVDNSNDKKIKEQIEVILNEYEYEKLTSTKVPTTLTTEQMQELLELPIALERQHYLQFLYSKELLKIKTRLKKQTTVKPILKERKPIGIFDENQELIYGRTHNTMFQLITRQSTSRQYVRRLRTAALFGPKLVIDLDFERYVKKYESRRLLQQLAFLYNYNKYETVDPFDLHFVNLRRDEVTVQEMASYLHKCHSNDFMVSMHYNKSYLDVFPKERLVYLSPHSEEVLTSVSEDDIYIIGGIIDKSYRVPISLIKAREDGIRSAKLPISSYIKQLRGSRCLCINQVLAILHDWKINKDWEQTLRKNIPIRKQFTEEEIKLMDCSKRSKYV